MPEETRSALRERFPAPEWRVAGAARHRHSLIVTLSSPERRLIAKEYLAGGWRGEPADRARREHAVLTHLWSHRSRCGFRLPEPVALLETPPALVTGLLGGAPLDRGLGRALRRPERVLGARRAALVMGRLGESLARLAGVPPPAVGDSDGVGHRRRSLEQFRSGAAAESLPAPLVSRVLDLAERTGAAAGDGEGPTGTAHGDLGFWNVLREGESLGLVDFEGMGAAPRLSDLAQAVGQLDWMEVASGARRSRVAACRERLLSGFGGIDADLDQWRRLRVGFLAAKSLREARRGWEPGRLDSIVSGMIDAVEAEPL